jgi:hypothetical protein
MRKIALPIIACGLLLGAAFAQDKGANVPVASDAQPDGSVVLSGGSVAAGVGYVWGHGALHFQGSDHDFSISGVSIADAGAANISASGSVYNLKNVSDFAGNYAAVAAGITIGGGGSASYLRNEHGVVIKLVSTTVGLRFNLSANGVHVTLKS